MTVSTVSAELDPNADRVRGADLPRAAYAEWTKLWTVRSTWAALGAAAALVSLFALVDGLTGRSQHAHHDPEAIAMSATGSTATGILIMGQLAFITLATLVIASEYSTTSIRTTLQCVPIRSRVVVAKNLVLAPVCSLIGALVAGLGTLVSWLAMGHYVNPLHAGDVAELLIRAGGYLGLIAALVVGIGAVVRSVAGTVAAAIFLILLLPMMLGTLNVHALNALASYLPGGAGQVLLGTADGPSFGPLVAAAVLAGWTVAVNIAGATVLRLRDA